MAWCWLIARSAQRAHSHFRMAVELNPYDSETLIAAAMGMAFLGHMEDAEKWSALALSLNPLYPEYFLGYLAAIHFLAGDYEATISTVEKCPDVFPDLIAWLAAARAELGQKDEAANAYRSFCALTAPRWEGGSPLVEDDLERWLLDVMPIIWPEGRRNFEHGIGLARVMAGNDSGRRLTGSGA